MGHFAGRFEPDPRVYDLCVCGGHKRIGSPVCYLCHMRQITEPSPVTDADIAARRVRESILDAALDVGWTLEELMSADEDKPPKIQDLVRRIRDLRLPGLDMDDL